MLIFFTLVIFAHISSAQTPAAETSTGQCPTTRRLPETLSPEILRGYVNTTTVDSPEDLICCLARDQNAEIAIAHSSPAAQNGDANNPRVLMITRHPNGEIKSIFSVNSGATHLHQGHSVEMMYNDPVRGELSFYDIDFSSRQPMSRANPQLCMNCHAAGQESLPGGPRPIFDRDPWPGFVMPDQGTNCPVRSRINNSLHAAAESAVNTNPRYACLRNLPRTSVPDLDKNLSLLNTRAIAREIQSSPDYHKFKYAIVASLMCPNFVPEDYFPADTLATLNQNRTLNTDIRSVSPAGMRSYLDTAFRTNLERSRVQDQGFANVPGLLASGNNVRIDTSNDVANACTERPLNQRNLGFLNSTQPLYVQYRADTLARGGDPNLGAIRYLFEARGINISHWNMQPSGGYSRAPLVPIVRQLQAMELGNSPFKQLSLQLTATSTSSGEPVDAPVCARLKELSLSSFGASVPTTEPKPESIER